MVDYDRIQLIQELIRDEGKRLTPYRDTNGFWTVGVGHLLIGNELARFVDPVTGIVRRKMTEATCGAVLNADIEAAERNLTRIVPDWRELDTVRQRALLNLSFNLGSKLAQFQGFLSHVARREWLDAGEHLANSLWWRQVKSRGPRIRRMIETGTSEQAA